MKSRKIYQEEEGPSYNDPPYPPDTGYLILAIACMVPEYICVEKACAIYYGNYKDLDRVRIMSCEELQKRRDKEKKTFRERQNDQYRYGIKIKARRQAVADSQNNKEKGEQNGRV